MIAIIDSQTGNIGSLLNALACIEAPAEIVRDPAALPGYDALVLPGVGAFDHAMATLHQRGLDEGIQRFAATGRPVLGICLGMQLLCKGSDEGECAGLGLLDARIEHLGAMGCHGKVPHVGFNDVTQQVGDSDFISATTGQDFYFVHSYGLAEAAARRDASLRMAITEYEGARFVAAFQRGAVFATQFHPEKSGEAGVTLLQRFVSCLRSD